MRRTDIPPTKSNLLRMREHFAFVKAGHALLEQKREVLLEELLDIYRESHQARREVETQLAQAYAALRGALLAGGRAALEADALAHSGSQALRVRERSVMGVTIPLLDLEAADVPGGVTAPGWTAPGVAAVRRRIRRLLPALVRLAEVEVQCRRIAAELRKTQRKVNAVEHVFLPEYRDTIRFIEGTLEEKEREALFHLKRFKHRREAAEEGE